MIFQVKIDVEGMPSIEETIAPGIDPRLVGRLRDGLLRVAWRAATDGEGRAVSDFLTVRYLWK